MPNIKCGWDFCKHNRDDMCEYPGEINLANIGDDKKECLECEMFEEGEVEQIEK